MDLFMWVSGGFGALVLAVAAIATRAISKAYDEIARARERAGEAHGYAQATREDLQHKIDGLRHEIAKDYASVPYLQDVEARIMREFQWLRDHMFRATDKPPSER